ncbi:MAG: 2,3-bisphosphoglycerate-independent phosphoglycerate mutase [bacterium]
MSNTNKKTVALIILDGWGLSPEKTGNAIAQAYTPTTDMLNRNYPHNSLQASGMSVGLYWSAMGNSEVGHLTIGSGRIIYQSFPRVSMAIEDKTFFKNSVLLEAIKHAKKNNKPLHIMGLLSDGGVHSHMDHVFALIKVAKENDIPLRIHAFTDGRDTGVKEAIGFIKETRAELKGMTDAKIVSVIGRAIAMDRNNHWDITQKAYECLTEGKGKKTKSLEDAIEKSYNDDITDEFINPITVAEDENDLITAGSSLIFFNFREDRARQLTKAFIDKEIDKFPRKKVNNLYFAGMIEYEKDLLEHILFPPQEVSNCLSEIISENGLKQFHIAETEKYAHVTYFFNGGIEEPHKGEDWQLVPSRPDGDYEKHPQMSAAQITAIVEKAIEKDLYNFILVNFANTDMVGHTGNLKSAIKATEEVDRCLDQILKAGKDKDIVFIITADHGNAECMIDPRTGRPQTDHTTNPVPIYIITPDNKAPQPNADFNYNRSIGILADIAPTVLDFLDLKKPSEMVGESLREKMA